MFVLPEHTDLVKKQIFGSLQKGYSQLKLCQIQLELSIHRYLEDLKKISYISETIFNVNK